MTKQLLLALQLHEILMKSFVWAVSGFHSLALISDILNKLFSPGVQFLSPVNLEKSIYCMLQFIGQFVA